MATDKKRIVTEDEITHVEEAFFEFSEEGRTEKKCPWCGGRLDFHGGRAGFSVSCLSCDFRATFRGI